MQELHKPTFSLQTLHFETVTVKSTIVSETLLYDFIKISKDRHTLAICNGKSGPHTKFRNGVVFFYRVSPEPASMVQIIQVSPHCGNRITITNQYGIVPNFSF
jgi:hypothetical protein